MGMVFAPLRLEAEADQRGFDLGLQAVEPRLGSHPGPERIDLGAAAELTETVEHDIEARCFDRAERVGDVATEASIRSDGDEGLFASYSDVQFRAPVRAGDVLEVTAKITRAGRRSRQMSFEARVVCRADPERSPSAAAVLAEPIVAVTAEGTVVIPQATS